MGNLELTATPLIGFNGVYTIQNLETGEHRTFSIRRQKDDARFAPGERIAALLTGPDNETSYMGFAFVRGDGSLAVWKAKRGGACDHYAKMLEMALGMDGRTEILETEIIYADRRYSVKLSKRCARCNRRLTTPESIERGVGPECAQIMGI